MSRNDRFDRIVGEMLKLICIIGTLYAKMVHCLFCYGASSSFQVITLL